MAVDDEVSIRELERDGEGRDEDEDKDRDIPQRLLPPPWANDVPGTEAVLSSQELFHLSKPSPTDGRTRASARGHTRVHMCNSRAL